MKLIDLTGKRFDKLVVISRAYNSKHGQPYWNCLCECGNEKIIAGNSLNHGKSKSCGCRQGKFTHGMWGKAGYKKIYLSDPVKRVRHVVGVGVRDGMKAKGKSKKGQSVFAKLSYTPQDLKEHLESLFEPWMSWDNYGGRNNSSEKTWHIDHIKPQSSFSFDSMDDPQFLECWDLTNLRPLEKVENIKKGNRYETS